VELELCGLGQIGSLAKHDSQWMCTRTLDREWYLRGGSKCKQMYIYNVVSGGMMHTWRLRRKTYRMDTLMLLKRKEKNRKQKCENLDLNFQWYHYHRTFRIAIVYNVEAVVKKLISSFRPVFVSSKSEGISNCNLPQQVLPTISLCTIDIRKIQRRPKY
jgi:hypothetical protein